MLETIRSAFKISDLRRRIFFTFWMFVIFRIGVHVPVPGIDRAQIAKLIETGAIFGFLDMVSGGALKNFSVFAMSIAPYINASIIMQLLTIVIPKLEQLSKEGEEGRKKITQYIRYGTIVLGLIQAIGTTLGIRFAIVGFSNHPVLYTAIIAISLTAGTAFLMWLGEQITEKGIGNGISLIIFAGIVARLPDGLLALWKYLKAGTVGPLSVLVFAILAVAVIAAIVLIQEGQRKIPVQYAKRVVGRRMYGGQSTHLPVKVNHAGVIPVIFASSILQMPITFASFSPTSSWGIWISRYLGTSSSAYMILYALFIIFFTYFYTAVTFNPVEVSDNIKKYGGFVPGFRPGRPTAEYLERVLVRLTLPGAVFLAAIAVLPYGIAGFTKIPTSSLYFGGTGLLIVVGVALETMKQLEAHLMMRHYQGFMK